MHELYALPESTLRRLEAFLDSDENEHDEECDGREHPRLASHAADLTEERA